MEKLQAIQDLMRTLGPRSLLIDLRAAPALRRELQRRQHLKRNQFQWPDDRAAQRLHPIGLRDAFGMRYRHLPGLVHFIDFNAKRAVDRAFPLHSNVYLSRPAACAPLVDLISKRYPLLLVDEPEYADSSYAHSLRRAVVLHLYSLFAGQIQVLPEN